MPPKITMAKIVRENEKPKTAGRGQPQPPPREGAGEAGQADGDAEDARPCTRTRSCRALGRLPVLADALQHPTERRLTEAPAQTVYVNTISTSERDHPVARPAQRPPEELRLRQADEAVGAAELRERREDPDDHRRDRQRQQDEVLAGQLHAPGATRACRRGREDHPEDGSRQEVPPVCRARGSPSCSHRRRRRRRSPPTPDRRSRAAGSATARTSRRCRIWSR